MTINKNPYFVSLSSIGELDIISLHVASKLVYELKIKSLQTEHIEGLYVVFMLYTDRPKTTTNIIITTHYFKQEQSRSQMLSFSGSEMQDSEWNMWPRPLNNGPMRWRGAVLIELEKDAVVHATVSRHFEEVDPQRVVGDVWLN